MHQVEEADVARGPGSLQQVPQSALTSWGEGREIFSMRNVLYKESQEEPHEPTAKGPGLGFRLTQV